MVNRCNMLLLISDFLSSKDLVKLPLLPISRWSFRGSVELGFENIKHYLIPFSLIMFLLVLWEGLAEHSGLNTVFAWDLDGTTSKLSVTSTRKFYRQISNEWSRNVEFLRRSFCSGQLYLTTSLRVFSLSCHKLVDTCVLKLQCCLTSSTFETFVLVAQWFILHTDLEKMPAATLNQFFIGKNFTSYQFSISRPQFPWKVWDVDHKNCLWQASY